MKLKAVFLFLALILPVLVFLFLRFFGKNEFAVKPLYAEVYPEIPASCSTSVTLPYHIPDSIRSQLPFKPNGLIVLVFGELKKDAQHELTRIAGKFDKDPVSVLRLEASGKGQRWKDCVFFLKNSEDLALVDHQGVIRGVYESLEREEIDRPITELTIILNKY